MNEQGEQGAKCYDYRKHRELFEITDDNGFQYLRRHFKFKAEGKSVCKGEFYVVLVFFDKRVQIVPKGSNGTYYNDRYSHYLTYRYNIVLECIYNDLFHIDTSFPHLFYHIMPDNTSLCFSASDIKYDILVELFCILWYNGNR